MKSLFVLLVVLIGSGSLSAQQCDTGVAFSGPIVITTGGAYTGNWLSTDPTVPAVRINTGQPVTIMNSRIKGPGDLILGGNFSDAVGIVLTVQQTCFVGTNPNVVGRGKGSGIWINNVSNLLVQNCDFESTGIGVTPHGYVGDHTVNNTVRVLKNRFHNLDGRRSDGNGGYQPATADNDGVSAVQLAKTLGMAGVEIAWNQIVNEPNQSFSGDALSLYVASGTSASPIQIHDNFIQGQYAFPATAAAADAIGYTSAGVQNDGPPETDPNNSTSFAKIHDNQAVNVAFCGVSIAVGHDLEMYSNRVVSSGLLSDGANMTNPDGQGIIHSDVHMNPPSAFGNNSVHDNVSAFRVRRRNGNWVRGDFYFSSIPSVSFNNTSLAPVTADFPTFTDEANEFLLWNEKLIANNITLGSNLVTPVLSGSVQIVGGDNQVGIPKSTLAPLTARVVNQSGAAVAGVNVSFMVASGNATATQHFAVTDTNGIASSSIVLGTAPAPVHVSVIASGYASATFTGWISQPAASILTGGIAGVGGSVPAVHAVSQNGLISIYGQGFLPAGATGRRVLPSEYVNGGLPSALLGVCVDVSGQRAAMLDVYPTQINAQVPAVTGSSVSLRVLTNCGTPAEIASTPQTVTLSAASPEFLYFQGNANGTNPVVLVNASTGALVGPSNILSGILTPAHVGDILTAYATGFGALTPPVATGQFPPAIAWAVGPVSVTIGGVALASADILYAGAAPTQIIDQLNFRVPPGVPAGNQPIIVTIAGVSSPPNAFVAVQQ